MDGAWLGSIDIAQKKARTARWFDMPTGVIGTLSQPGGSLYNIEHSNGGLITFPGGLPLKNDNGDVIGAIGVSGSSVEDDHARAIVFRALDLGVNYFDTAQAYWDSEIKLGKALKGEREGVIVSSKTAAKTKEDAARHIRESLEKLQTDYIDNYHLHALTDLDDMDVRMGGPLEALVEAKEKGIIRNIGVTGHTDPSILVAALKRFDFDTFLVPLNIVEREPLAELIPLAIERNIGITIMKPVATGLLPAPLALKWLLNQQIAVACPGATTLEEVDENSRIAQLDDITLSAEEEAEVVGWVSELATERCRICMQCLPCPSDINFPSTLGTDVLFNHYRAMGPTKFAAFPWEQSRIDDDRAPRENLIAKINDHDACDSCRVCESRCPYNLPIVPMLRKMVPDMENMLDIWSKQGAVAR
jgi:predicted aldo/keto reductase-like oxidoreductase